MTDNEIKELLAVETSSDAFEILSANGISPGRLAKVADDGTVSEYVTWVYFNEK
jgi:hypothetical protein